MTSSLDLISMNGALCSDFLEQLLSRKIHLTVFANILYFHWGKSALHEQYAIACNLTVEALQNGSRTVVKILHFTPSPAYTCFHYPFRKRRLRSAGSVCQYLCRSSYSEQKRFNLPPIILAGTINLVIAHHVKELRSAKCPEFFIWKLFYTSSTIRPSMCRTDMLWCKI